MTLLKLSARADAASSTAEPNRPAANLDESFVVSLTHAVQQEGGQVYRPVSPHRTDARFDASQWHSLSEIVVGLGSAGVFTVLYKIIARYLDRNKAAEISFERSDIKITVKGHSLPAERELLAMLCPELSETNSPTSRPPVAERGRPD
jgi:hypothetical protein